MSDERPEKQPPPETTPDTGPTVDPMAVPGEDPTQAQEAEPVGLTAYGEPYARDTDEPGRPAADELVERVRAALRHDSRTRHTAEHVVIQVNGDIVQLRGTVDTPATVEACIDVAQSVAGVGEVRNELQS
jgi:hypothetical protein